MNPLTTARHLPGRHEPKKPLKPATAGFGVFGLCPELVRAITQLEWTEPTPVQDKALPLALQGHDLIALAQTGTGKTGAFVLPLLQAVRSMRKARPLQPYAVVLAPTRELVQQIETQVKALGQDLRVRSMTIFGGVSERPQIAQLKSGVEIVVATPGRLLDLIGQGYVKFDDVTHCVLDESDRMFDMGFIRDLRRILALMPTRRQTMLFSATMPQEIQQLTREFLHNPREVRLSVSSPPPELDHEVWELESAQKNAALEVLLREDYDSVLVFTRTKHRANSVARRLERSGASVAVLHGNRSQNQRDLALARFRRGQARILVATDVASRGLDIVGIGLVVNYDTPRDPDDYVHRVGRTARAQRKGCAISFQASEEATYIQKIEKLLKLQISRHRPNLSGVPRSNGSAQNTTRVTDSSPAKARPEQKQRRRRSASRRFKPGQ